MSLKTKNYLPRLKPILEKGFSGIFMLPDVVKFGVYTAYKYYLRF